MSFFHDQFIFNTSVYERNASYCTNLFTCALFYLYIFISDLTSELQRLLLRKALGMAVWFDLELMNGDGAGDAPPCASDGVEKRDHFYGGIIAMISVLLIRFVSTGWMWQGTVFRRRTQRSFELTNFPSSGQRVSASACVLLVCQ